MTGIFDTIEVLDKIQDEIQAGIDRNGVLPLDWCMDRIKPLIEAESQRLRQEVEKSFTKVLSIYEDKGLDEIDRDGKVYQTLINEKKRLFEE